ncbi:uncharacterized protein CDAR_220521 [Caerostris darwini]|uniref:Apple domain-containing protein n=1 Tax=Caerostris darwini TaxID=1538125 RepID=A0AAV4UFI9_9ARAC|nr:uncharacterized protein CDAR_220521 [Caerostris darwini]
MCHNTVKCDVQYQYSFKDKLPLVNVMTEKRAPNKMHCAAYCTKESHCKAFGIDSKDICFLLNEYMNEDFCSDHACTDKDGVKIYKGPPKPTTDALPTGRTGSMNEIEHPNQGIPIVPTVTVPFVVQNIPVVASVPVTANPRNEIDINCPETKVLEGFKAKGFFFDGQHMEYYRCFTLEDGNPFTEDDPVYISQEDSSGQCPQDYAVNKISLTFEGSNLVSFRIKCKKLKSELVERDTIEKLSPEPPDALCEETHVMVGLEIQLHQVPHFISFLCQKRNDEYD